jgi:hypothetical protein
MWPAGTLSAAFIADPEKPPDLGLHIVAAETRCARGVRPVVRTTWDTYGG